VPTELAEDETPSILLVDDVEANLVALEAVLGRLDCHLVRARSGNEALTLLLKREFAAILLDVQMPGMDGFEVARLARLDPSTKETPIIFVTALHATDENVFRGYETGAVDLLFKPVNAFVLLSKVGVFIDLHRSRRALARAIDVRDRTLADLESFNYSVAHDLRNPLRAVKGFSQIVLEDHGPALAEDARAHLGRISAAASRMEQLIDDLLRLSRIGRAPVNPEPLDMTELVEAVVADLRAADPTRTVDVAIASEVAGKGDVRLVKIVLENLLRNAWKFTKKKQQAEIAFGARDEDGATVFFVRDNGAGFDPAYAHRMFTPFQRFHGASEFEGTGIGLAIVRRIVDHHHGRVWAESKPGEGATFSFTLR
jgi:signal transduction histidine kinase